jgi:eukaryotic-like serine/threonine-protein kinase
MAVVSIRFGRYDLLRPIGKGGMAEVFLARYAGPEGFEKQLVIKRVLPKISESPRLLRMFFEEAKTQVSLSHGNLVSVFDFGRVDNDYFIAMDYVRGADLALLFTAERAADRRLAAPLLAHVGVEICRALAYVHGRGFVHRDVTPRNVLLSADGEIKLSDFGLALAMQSSLAGDHPGTPSYMAPEQARGDRVDARADIYSLGLILFEGLLGRGLRVERADVGVVAPADLAAQGPLGPIVERAIRTSPDDRFAGAAEMLAALETEIARAGASREALVRELAAKIQPLVPADDARAEPSARVATAPTAASSRATQESYFRDHRSPGFVDTMLGRAAARARILRGVAVGAVSAALLAAGALAVRAQRAGEPARSPAAVSAPAVAPPPDRRLELDVSRPRPDPTPVAVAGRSGAPSPAAPVARGAARTLVPAAAPPAAGIIRIRCKPWCVPYVDGKAAGSDGRSFVVRVPAGRHRVEARRLDDNLERQLDVADGEETAAQFDFDDR